jgi:CTP synthase (UTP-ammonia lyase)
MVTVGIIGDFNSESETHRATNEALHHAAHTLAITVTVSWIPTTELSHGAVEQALEPFDALWAAPGSPYRSMEGALRGIRLPESRDGPSSAPEAISNMLWWSMRETFSTSMRQTMKRLHLKLQP